MKYEERKQLMEALQPDGLAAGGKDAIKAECYFRWHQLQLLCSIADSVDSMAYAYQEMLKIQRSRENRTPQVSPYADLPPTERSRYGGPASGREKCKAEYPDGNAGGAK
jgi:hypothetical protein